MKILWRGVLFYSFVILFLVAGAALLLYANGYRYSAQKRLLEKTGELIIETKPNGASIFLDEKDTGKKAPFHLKSLLPGTYVLSVTKSGYFPFVQEISLSSGRVTIIDGVELISDHTPILLFEYKDKIIDFVSFTPRTIFFTTQYSLLAYDRLEKKIKVLVRAQNHIDIVTSKTAPSLAVFYDAAASIIDKHTLKLTRGSALPHSFRKPKISDTAQLYGITLKGIDSYDPLTGKSKRIRSGIFRDISIHNGFLYAIEERRSTIFLVRIQIRSGEFRDISQLPESAVSIESILDSTIIVKTSSTDFISFDTSSFAPTEVLRGIQKLVFPMPEYSVVASEYEVWVFERGSQKQKRLLVRQQTPITQAFLASPTPYVLVASRNTLDLIEAYDRSMPNRFAIVRNEEIGTSAIDQQERALIYSTHNVQGWSVYERVLLDDIR